MEDFLEQELTRINNITNDLHDDVASINEELVDGNKEEVENLIDTLTKKLRHLKSNL